MKKFGSVDEFLDELENWNSETRKLVELIRSIGLEETVKWSMPVYVSSGKNVVGVFATKSYFGLWFYQGALMEDKDNVLMNAQEGKTKALRQWRMTSKKEIKVRTIKRYVLEAMKLAAEGKEIKPARNKPLVIPELLQQALSENKKANTAFAKMSKSCQREYADYISEAKRDETKLRRLTKIMPMIVASVGLNDKYRK